MFLPFRGRRSADAGYKAVEVGSFSGLSPAKSPLDTILFSCFHSFIQGPGSWPFCRHSGTDFQLLQKNCPAVYLPTFRFPGLSGLRLAKTMASWVLDVLRGLDLSDPCTCPLSMKSGTERISLVTHSGPGSPFNLLGNLTHIKPYLWP